MAKNALKMVRDGCGLMLVLLVVFIVCGVKRSLVEVDVVSECPCVSRSCCKLYKGLIL